MAIGFILDFVLRGLLPALCGRYTGRADEVDCHEDHADAGNPPPLWKAAARHTLEIFVFIFAFSLLCGWWWNAFAQTCFADALGQIGFSRW